MADFKTALDTLLNKIGDTIVDKAIDNLIVKKDKVNRKKANKWGSKFISMKNSNLVKSMKTNINSQNQLEIIMNDYAVYVNDGRRAGARQPPINSLVGWAKKRNIDRKYLFVIARAIGRNGIKETNFMEGKSFSALDYGPDQHIDEIEKIIEDYADELFK